MILFFLKTREREEKSWESKESLRRALRHTRGPKMSPTRGFAVRDQQGRLVKVFRTRAEAARCVSQLARAERGARSPSSKDWTRPGDWETGAHSHGANNLILFADSTGELYPEKKRILELLKGALSRGAYDKDLARATWDRWLLKAQRQYRREFGSDAERGTMTASARKDAAHVIEAREHRRIESGEYGPMLQLVQSSPRPFREITRADVNKARFKAFGRTWSVSEFIGRIMPQDIGKRVYLVAPNMVQVENEEQRARRLAGAHSWPGQPRRHAHAAKLGLRRRRHAHSPAVFRTLADVKEANHAAGHHFFERGALRFFNSRMESGLLRGKYFVTSEQGPHGPRMFTIREARPDGSIKTVGPFMAFRFKEDAKDAIKALG